MGAMPFDVIPAIDIRGGKCVRLSQGDYARETVFSDDPAAVAAVWTAAGASIIHVVDLDGAAQGRPTNLAVLKAVRAATRSTIQFGGGLRSDESVQSALEAGADRVVLGTALVTQPDWVARLCADLPERIVVGIDAKQGRVATQGWLAASPLATEDAVRLANSMGVRRALCTDIARDGTLEGPNVVGLRQIIEAAQFEVIASGGVATLADIEAVRAIGAAAVVVGRALYTGRVDLRTALARAGDRESAPVTTLVEPSVLESQARGSTC